MGFNDIFKQSFLKGFTSTNIGVREAVIVLFVTFLLAVYVFYVYRLVTAKAFYSQSFNISLVVVALVTASIILTIQTSIVVSLGMVGALSIVRFRTAIKEPMDLAFLFWVISVGIICGSGNFDIAFVLTLWATVAIFILNKIPIARAPKILVIKYEELEEAKALIEQCIKEQSKECIEKSKSVVDQQVDVVYEIRIKDENNLSEELSKIEGVKYVALLKHDGEVTF